MDSLIVRIYGERGASVGGDSCCVGGEVLCLGEGSECVVSCCVCCVFVVVVVVLSRLTARRRFVWNTGG